MLGVLLLRAELTPTPPIRVGFSQSVRASSSQANACSFFSFFCLASVMHVQHTKTAQTTHAMHGQSKCTVSYNNQYPVPIPSFAPGVCHTNNLSLNNPPSGGDDFGSDLLPAAGLVTSSEDYYPTVAINALMRVLRDSALASQHQVRGW